MDAAIAAGMAYFGGNKRGALDSGLRAVTLLLQNPQKSDETARQRQIEIRSTVADVIQFSGCRDEQTSADGALACCGHSYHILICCVQWWADVVCLFLWMLHSRTARIGGESTGAMSWAFREAFAKGGFDQTYIQLLGHIRTILSGKYAQVPQMSTGHKMNMKTAFKM